MVAFKFTVLCRLHDCHEDYEVWAVSAEHARKIALCVFFQIQDMDKEASNFIALASSQDLVRVYPGLEVLAEQEPEEIEA